MFSKSCEYGIRAVVFIAIASSKGRKVGFKEIAREIASPEAFTGKILQTLVKHKIIMSFKGPSGGFFMPEESLSRIKLVDIVSATDGDAVFRSCPLGLNRCSEDMPCPVHDKFKCVRSELEQMLHSVSIADLTKNINTQHAFLKRGIIAI